MNFNAYGFARQQLAGEQHFLEQQERARRLDPIRAACRYVRQQDRRCGSPYSPPAGGQL